MDLIARTLPTMQLVCHMVALSNVTNSAVNVQSPQQHQPTSLYDGYVLFPDTNAAAYKVYNESKTVLEARNLCAKEGAWLAVLDSYRKVEYIRKHHPFATWIHAGVIRIGETWVNINTGLPLSSSPWRSDEPSGWGDCTLLTQGDNGIANYGCDEEHPYACELPISSQNTTVAH